MKNLLLRKVQLFFGPDKHRKFYAFWSSRHQTLSFDHQAQPDWGLFNCLWVSELTVHLIKEIINVVPQVISSCFSPCEYNFRSLQCVWEELFLSVQCVWVDGKKLGVLKSLVSWSLLKKFMCISFLFNFPWSIVASVWVCMCTQFYIIGPALISCLWRKFPSPLPFAAFLNLSNQMH